MVDMLFSRVQVTFAPSVHQRLVWAVAVGLLALCAGMSVRPASAQPTPVPTDARAEKIADGFEFTEGPVWHEGRLLFTDIPANRVYEWQPEAGARVFLEPSGHANGLAVGPDGHLLLAQHDGQVGRLEEGGIHALATNYDGRRLNSPNDLTVAADGAIYFTDPPYGVDEAERELSFSGVYRLSPSGTLTLLVDSLARPNGIGLSPDGSTLYVSDSEQTVVYAYDVATDGTLRNGRRFATPRAEADGTTDGLAVDAEGHLYTTGPGGVWVYAPDGTQRARIPIPGAPTNLAFGGPKGTTLYVTAPPSVYRAPVRIPAAN